MIQRPRFGEVWLAPEGTILPGGMLCLVVSADDINQLRNEVIIVEVVKADIAAAGALAADLGALGVALTASPFTVGLDWFRGADKPVDVLPRDKATAIANQVRAVLGP